MIKVNNCSVTYPDGTKGLDDVSFLLEDTEALALLGENGAGKSTLISALGGFIFPDEGTIEIAGLKLDKKNLKTIRKKIGVVFQNSDDQLFMPTVYEDVAFGPANAGFKGEDLKIRVEEALNLTGIYSLKDKEPDRLSGGEKRRAAIAGVIAMRPDVIIMDEPTSGLDYRAKKHLIELLNNIKSAKIIATHDMNFAGVVCDKSLVLRRGQTKFFGNTADIFNDTAFLEECNLEPPVHKK